MRVPNILTVWGIMVVRKSDLPFGSEFSPSQIELAPVLELADEYGGDWRAFEKAVRETYFEGYNTSDSNKAKLANNTKLSMIAYGIIDRDANLTEFGRKLYEMRHNEEQLYVAMARHILLNLHGMNLIQCVKDIQAAGETVTLIKLRAWLDERGIHFPRGGKHPSIMRLWLEKAGILQPDSWDVNETRLQEVLGTSIKEFDILSIFTAEQRAYLKALTNIEGGTHLSNEIAKLATATYGVAFDEKNLPKQVLYPLQRAGYIKLERGTKSPGRGAKPFYVTITERFKADILGPLLEQIDTQVRSELRPLLRKSLDQILDELSAKETHIRGLALEALAFRLMRLIDLEYVGTRLRGSETGGAEVDLIFEGARLVYSRWQVQCKNTARVSLDDIAKEVGLTHFLKTNVIVIVTTGEIGTKARQYANKIMTDSNLCIVTIDGNDLAQIRSKPVAIVDVLNREARHAMTLKTLEI